MNELLDNLPAMIQAHPVRAMFALLGGILVVLLGVCHLIVRDPR